MQRKNHEYLALGNDDEAGEPALVVLLSGFSCSKNPNVERFLEKSAIEFTKRNQSVTYLVVSAEDVRLLGYFTFALKPLTVRGETVSNTMKRKLLRISELDVKFRYIYHVGIPYCPTWQKFFGEWWNGNHRDRTS